MSGEFWSSLCNEVGGLRHALEQSTDSDDEDDNEGTTPESVGGGSAATPTAPGMLLGSQRGSGSQAIEHPSPEHIRYLASVFFMNVDMHLKILHRPTILEALSNLANNPDTAPDLSPELTALFFAIYYAAITSLAPEACARNLGRSRSDLAAVFQAGIEQALVRADYLNNTRLEPLQALTLYTSEAAGQPRTAPRGSAREARALRISSSLGPGAGVRRVVERVLVLPAVRRPDACDAQLHIARRWRPSMGRGVAAHELRCLARAFERECDQHRLGGGQRGEL
ncbi:hypothetical protein NUW58_g10694 [Xylaria curta]|uniref:Uncharacterized protein n=1 Tax=Xylaria curta TaxID=42375 RepID=A0ACC1MI56_9PEZI|nr:hypothetical protein NUW58_g10694 [Xylaria curta]